MCTVQLSHPGAFLPGGQSRGGKSELQKKLTNQEIELGVSEVEQSENLRELHRQFSAT